MKTPARGAVLLLVALLPACSREDDPGEVPAEFVVSAGSETFVMRVTDPETIRLAQEGIAGRNQRFPIGPLLRGDGGFNAPWSWHFDPDRVRMTELAIEVCDGRPSYVEAHLADFPTYCPWGARVVRQR
ncbi:MAG TPA: hypothetical protein VFQ51_20420 [Vicinamibacteria bacterium]|nr:hypothetical protein [Vicinamibacteria bacterium]